MVVWFSMPFSALSQRWREILLEIFLVLRSGPFAFPSRGRHSRVCVCVCVYFFFQTRTGRRKGGRTRGTKKGEKYGVNEKQK